MTFSIDAFDNKTLELIILPTEECNFRCTYCYEDFAIGKMSPKIVEALKRFITKRAEELSNVSIEWFGGEPMLEYGIVTDVMDHTQRLFGGKSLNGSMTTNASLLDEKRFRKLVSLGVSSYQISLDGLPIDHDMTRKNRGGNGTFDKIWQNLTQICEIKDLDFSILLRVHFSPEKLANLPKFIVMLDEAFGHDERFRIFLKPIGRYGGENDGVIEELSKIEEEQVFSQLLSLRPNIKMEDGTRGATMKNMPVCYAAKANAFVVRANGLLSKCTVDLRSQKNLVGKINDNGSLDLDVQKMKYWLRGHNNGKVENLYCPAHT